tara:strand:- start:371 stop:1186 length:816 start_codon:yes stop_codon:yes gene_type:complete
MPELTNYTPSPAIDPRDLQTRKELLPAQETTEDMYRPDTNADPEGADRRENTGDFPIWVYNEHMLSNLNIFGKPFGKVLVSGSPHNFADGNPHLVPTGEYVAHVIDTYKRIMQPDFVTPMKDSVKEDIKSDWYQVKVKSVSLGSNTQQWREYEGTLASLMHALANRAIKRVRWQSVRDNNDSGEPTKKQEDAFTSMLEASAQAGIYYHLLEETQKIRGKKMPDFTAEYLIDNTLTYEVKNALQSSANWIDLTYRNTEPKKPTVKDYDEIKC